MTEDEMAAEADRALAKYARNERQILCLSGRMQEISQALNRLARVTESHQAKSERKRAIEAIGDRNIPNDIDQLAQALSDRETLKEALEPHGYAHMILRASGGKIMPADDDD